MSQNPSGNGHVKAGRNMTKGKIVQVVGPVVDVEFPEALPTIYNALTVECKVNGQSVKLTLEYNKLRQNNITQELLEIAGGQAG